jgi:Icc-related predicted phosphoesterase
MKAWVRIGAQAFCQSQRASRSKKPFCGFGGFCGQKFLCLLWRKVGVICVVCGYTLCGVMRIAVLGDIHGDFESVRRIMQSHSGVRLWLCVGDLPDEDGRYHDVDAPLYFIKGNNENFDAIAGGQLAKNLHFVPNAARIELEGLVIAGLGGTFAPTWYETPAADLPHPKKGSARATELADKRRHFVREEVEACKGMRGVDIFLTHEAPKPYRPYSGGRGPDAGKAQINDVLAAMKPRLHFFGHHHRFSESERGGVQSIGLDLVSRSFVALDPATLACTRIDLL